MKPPSTRVPFDEENREKNNNQNICFDISFDREFNRLSDGVMIVS